MASASASRVSSLKEPLTSTSTNASNSRADPIRSVPIWPVAIAANVRPDSLENLHPFPAEVHIYHFHLKRPLINQFLSVFAAPCDSVKCGVHATCKAQGDEAFCICDDGWTYDPANITAGCQDIDECDLAQGVSLAPQSRCGESAICSNTPGSFSCACPPGFTGDPSVRCHGNLFINQSINCLINYRFIGQISMNATLEEFVERAPCA